MIKGLIKVYTMRDKKHISGIAHGIVANKGINMSMLFSLLVHMLFFD